MSHKQKLRTALKRVVAAACVAGMAITMLPAQNLFPKAEASHNKGYDAKESLKPLLRGFSMDSLMAWEPENDQDVEYNSSSVALRDRYEGPLMNPNATHEAKGLNNGLASMDGDNQNPQGGDFSNAYAFSYWQYLNEFAYWGSGTSEGLIIVPSSDMIDAAHNAGVPITATLGFPWAQTSPELAKMLTKNPDGTFPYADKMIELCETYGFDGYFWNQEATATGIGGQAAGVLVRDFMAYMVNNFEGNCTSWYDAQSNYGYGGQNSLNMENNWFFNYYDEANQKWQKTSDHFFINYGWGSSTVNTAKQTALSLNRSPFDVCVGLEVQQNGIETAFRMPTDANGVMQTSVAFFCPNSTHAKSLTMEEFYKNDRDFWVGKSWDPRVKTDKHQWKGAAQYMADATANNDLPFVTSFELGQGHKYFDEGEQVRNRDWNWRGIQSVAPTWTWVIDSEGSKLAAEYDFEDAYNGGTSVQFTGKLDAGKDNRIKLFSTNLKADKDLKVSVTYKTPNDGSKLQVGLAIANSLEDASYDESSFTYFDLDAAVPGEWTTSTITLGEEYCGKTIAGIGLKVMSDAEIADYTLNIGQIAIEEADKAGKTLAAPKNARFTDIMEKTSGQTEFRLAWDRVADEDINLYEVYRVDNDGTKTLLGATRNRVFYVSPVSRNAGENSFKVEIVPVSKSYVRGTPATLTYNWNMGEGETGVNDIREHENFCLFRPVTCSGENENEPAVKAVDGVVGNSSKWCHSLRSSGWLAVDLEQERTIQRWRVDHGEAGGEDRLTNTHDFSFQVSDDGINYRVVDRVSGNWDAVTDRLLAEPVQARYVKLNITNAGSSPWQAIRIYEFSVYQDPILENSSVDSILMHNTKTVNNAGANDELIFANQKQGNIINVYESLDAEEPIRTETVPSDGLFTISGLDVNDEGGSLYCSVEAMRGSMLQLESARLKADFYAVNAEKTPLPKSKDVDLERYQYGEKYAPKGLYGTMSIRNLAEGAVVRLYNHEDDVFCSKMLPAYYAGQTSSTIEPIQLNKDGGVLYLTVQNKGMPESAIFALEYDANGESQGNRPVLTGAPESGATRSAVTLTADREVTFVVNGVEAGKITTTMRFNDEGAYTVTAIDADGLESKPVTFAIDRTAPVLSADCEHYGYTNKDVTFTANEEVTFNVNGENVSTGTILVLSKDGLYNVRAYDKAGNYTAIYRVTIDKQAPVLSGVPENGVTRGNVAIAADTRVQYYINGELANESFEYRLAITAEGTYTVKAVDMAGNETVVTFAIDRTKPTFTATVPSGQATNQDITLTADEVVNFMVNDEIVATGTEYTITDNGITVVRIYDIAGNYGGGYKANIDKIAPELTAVIAGTDKVIGSGSTVPKPVVVKSSEPAYFIINDGEPTTRANFVKLVAEGTYEVKATDALGNVSRTFKVTIDKDATDPPVDPDEPVEPNLDIYPVPQNLTYLSDTAIKLTDEINIVVHGDMVGTAVAELQALLTENGYTSEVSGSAMIGRTNIFLTSDAANCAECGAFVAEQNITLPTEAEGYVMSVCNDVNTKTNITIAGADKSGVYYGIKSLGQMFAQKTETGRLHEVMITDYPEIGIRGIIEGFYGFPWTHEDRQSLMEFGGNYKMNTFIYAPKDDPYHRAKWATLYPEKEAQQIAELAQKGHDSGVNFVWTIHPGDSINLTSESDFQKALAKLEQVYSLGVRQFGVLFDDISYSSSGKEQAEFINRVDDEFVKVKGDVKPLITVGTRYNSAIGPDPDTYLAPFVKTLHDDVSVMWTGHAVMSNINREVFEWPKERINTDKDFMVWWNYPVNDYAAGKILMGKMDMLGNDLDNVSGFVSNPMCEADASKAAIFGIADYTWNVGAFDADKSWNAEIEAIAPEVADSMKIFASNVCYVLQDGSRSGKFEFDESFLMEDKLQAVEKAIADGASVTDAAKAMIDEFNGIIAACADIKENLVNQNLLDEIRSHLNALTRLAEAGIDVMNALIYADGAYMDASDAAIAQANAKMATLPGFKVSTLNGTISVDVGVGRLQPFLTQCMKSTRYVAGWEEAPQALEYEMDNIALASKGATASSTSASPNENEGPEKAIDGVIGGSKWCTEKSRPELVINLGKVANIKQYRIICSGHPDAAEGASTNLKTADIYLSMNGTNWTKVDSIVNNTGHTINRVLATPMDAQYVKLHVLVPNQNNNIATRINEVEIYDRVYPMQSDTIKEKDVTIVNNSGANDSVSIKEVQAGDTIELFNAIGDETPIASMVAEGTTVTFKGLALNGDGGRVFYRVSRENEVTSPKSSKAYGAEVQFITNTEIDAAVAFENGDMVLKNLPATNFATGDYVGIKLPAAASVTQTFLKTQQSYNVKVQYSLNGIEWTTVQGNITGDEFTCATPADATYVRVVNLDDAIDVTIDEFRVTSGGGSVTEPTASTNMKEYQTYLISNLVDGKYDTKFWEDGSMLVGQYIQIDMGSVVPINDVKIYMDKANDYIRGADVKISEDGSSWLTIGQIGNNYKEAEGLKLGEVNGNGAMGRYVRFEITTPHSNWLQIYEVEINKSTPADGVTLIEATAEGNALAMIDNNLGTAYEPASIQNGDTVVYKMTTNTNIKDVAIFQDANSICNATVSVKDGDGKWTDIGTLDSAFNALKVETGKPVVEVKITFSDSQPLPVISEIYVK